jgi:hypothetical protein
MSDNDGVFISYRRTSGAAEARVVETYLASHGFDVFLDVDGLTSGYFDAQLLEQITARKHFILICSPGVLDRCKGEGDWVRQEIVHAIKTRRNIVPVELTGFTWPPREALPRDIVELTGHNSFRYDHAHWKSIRDKLLRMLGRPRGDSTVVSQKGSVQKSELATPGRPADVLSDADRRRYATARGLLAEVKRHGDYGNAARRPALKLLLDRTKVLPEDVGHRRSIVCLRVAAALELDDRDTGLVVAAELRDPTLEENPSDRQLELLAQVDARGWNRSAGLGATKPSEDHFLNKLTIADDDDSGFFADSEDFFDSDADDSLISNADSGVVAVQPNAQPNAESNTESDADSALGCLGIMCAVLVPLISYQWLGFSFWTSIIGGGLVGLLIAILVFRAILYAMSGKR